MNNHSIAVAMFYIISVPLIYFNIGTNLTPTIDKIFMSFMVAMAIALIISLATFVFVLLFFLIEYITKGKQ